MAFSAAILGRLDEVLPLTRRTVDLDPLNAHSWEAIGEIEFAGYGRRFSRRPDYAAGFGVLDLVCGVSHGRRLAFLVASLDGFG